MKIYLKYMILFCGFCAFGVLINGDDDIKNSLTGLGVVGAGCFIAFALIENNDIKEQNKD
jgi:hypothetical protein